MKCPECDGYGKVGKYNYYGTCPQCGGTGEMETEMTNEEWFCGLPTERKAHFFAERFGGSADRYNNIYDTMLEWLKEIHT